MARKYHPDRNRSSHAEEMIKKINAAFEVLADENKRSEYDKMNYDNIAIEETEGNSDFTFETANQRYQTAVSGASTTSHSSRAEENLTGDYHLDTPKGRFHIIIEPSICLAFGSCEILAPKVFVVEKNKRINPKARVESETGADFETILAAAQTCPTKAIKIIDRYTGEQIFP